jgi:methyl-accepting chemotaxis protein
LSDPTASTPGSLGPGASNPNVGKTRYKRKLSNYLLDKKLQLRYILVVTLLSGLIAGALGYMIYDQRHQSTQSIEQDLQDLVSDDEIKSITGDYETEDRVLVYKMIAAGVGLVVILSLYLILMTHKVAGPLYKTSIYFDRMAQGRLSVVTPLRRGDMLQDFFEKFKDMHDVVRQRAIDDVDAMEKALAALRESRNQGDYRGDTHNSFNEELDKLEQHLLQRKKQLV